jgi:hypothetical protein
VRTGAVGGFDALSALAPAAPTRRSRLAQRDGLDLPGRRAAFEAALREAGFDVSACAPALESFAHPASEVAESAPASAPDSDLASWVLARHVAREEQGALVATYVRPSGDPAGDARARAAILAADPKAVITGFEAIDRALRDALSHDLVRVGAVALGLVALGMRLALRSARQTLVALAALASEIAGVGLAMRLLAVRWHVYDALVLPVLFGVTIDESMFLLHAAGEKATGLTAREQAKGLAEPTPMLRALRKQGPLVAATGLTTAAGFVALVICRFAGLRDLGLVGTIGVLVGLVAALVMVPAAMRLVGGGSLPR